MCIYLTLICNFNLRLSYVEFSFADFNFVDLQFNCNPVFQMWNLQFQNMVNFNNFV